MIASAILSNKYVQWILIGLAAFAVFATTVYLYGDARYKAGVAETKAAYQQQVAAAEARARTATEALAAIRQERDVARSERDAARSQRLETVREEINNAATTDEAFAAYLEHRRSLRDAAAARHSVSRADYLSTVATDARAGPRSGGPLSTRYDA